MKLDNFNKDFNKYTKIVTQNPNNYDARIGLGILNIQINKINEAKLHFEKAIGIAKNRKEAYINLSNLYILQKKIFESINILKNFIKRNQYDKKIITNLASIYYEYNKIENLEKLISKYLNKEDNHILFYLKANLLSRKNKTHEAIYYFSKSIETNKKFWASYETIIILFEKLNQLNNLIKYIKLAKIHFSNEIKIFYYEALYLYRMKKYDLSIKLINKNKLEKKYKDNSHLVNVLDLLSKNYDKISNYELSYKYALTRNKIFSELEINKNYNKKIILDTIQSYKKFFLKRNLEKKLKHSKNIKHDNLVFLIGFPRSGTTLLDSILRSHSKTLVLEEQPFLLNIRHDFFQKNNHRIDALNTISNEEIFQIQKKYFNKINNINLYNKKIIIDKFPLNIIEIGFIKTIFPNAKIILALRHPCDVVLSSFLTHFKLNDAMANFLDVESSAYLYNEIFDLFEYYKNSLRLNFIEIKYEEVILNFDKSIKKLLMYLGLKYEKNMEKFYETAKKREKINTPSYNQVSVPLYTSSINRWKKYKNAKVIYPLLQRWISKYEYF